MSKRQRVKKKDPGRCMVQILRHGKFGSEVLINPDGSGVLNMDPDGYILVDDLLKVMKRAGHIMGTREIEDVLNRCDKKRMELSDDKTKIRAVQGHSLPFLQEDGLLEKLTENPGPLYHGTYPKLVSLIEKNGLSKMSRNHIHMTTGFPEDGEVISGMRSSCSRIIVINYDRAVAQGIEFFRSSNGVILSPGNNTGVIPPDCFDKIIIRS